MDSAKRDPDAVARPMSAEVGLTDPETSGVPSAAVEFALLDHGRACHEGGSPVRSEVYLVETPGLSSAGSWIRIASTGQIFWSPELFRILGLDPEKTEPSLEVFYQCVHPDDRVFVGEGKKLVQERGWAEYDFRIVRPEGSIKWIHGISSAIRDNAGQVFAVAGTALDITERKKAHDAVRRSEGLLAQGERISHVGSWHWDVSAGKAFWSQEHFRIYGYDPEKDQPSLSLFLARIHPDDRTAVEQACSACVREQRDFEGEYRIVLPDGTVKYIHDVARCFVSRSGDLEFFGTAMDITARKEAENELRRTEAYLAEAQRLGHT